MEEKSIEKVGQTVKKMKERYKKLKCQMKIQK